MLRGNGDEKPGKFYQIMLLRVLDDPSLLKWISRSYDRRMSSTSQNEILKLLALKISRKIVSEIEITGCCSILDNEAVDVSNTQQLVVCIDVITAAIKDVLTRLSQPISNAKAQSYDVCSTMVGPKIGAATVTKQSQPYCLLIHCYCHALNLTVGDAIKNVPLLKKL